MQISNLKERNNNQKLKTDLYNRLVEHSLSIIRLCGKLRLNPNLRPIADQLIRSGTSIGANIIEAKSCGTRKDYTRFFEIALRSANETKYWLILVQEADQDFKRDVSILLTETEEIGRIIGASVLTLKGKR